MPTLQILSRDKQATRSLSDISAQRRLLILGGLLLLAVVGYGFLIAFNPPDDEASTSPYLFVWLLCFVPYLAACGFVLLTPAPTGRQFWYELALVFGGALLFRGMLLPWPPRLSHDSWRYLWDARITLHGFSPYVYPPESIALIPLRDDLVFRNTGFHSVPSLYPPGAQAIYILSYLVAPSNLVFLKSVFVGFDLLSCGLLGYLLWLKGQDVRRVLLYAWCPLPIVEFATQGHVDAALVAVILLLLIAARSEKRGARVLTGVLLGLATLLKLYPIVLLLIVVRRRDWALVLACFMTILAGYLPYYLLGSGQLLGFFSTYVGEQGTNAGVIQVGLQWLKDVAHLDGSTTLWMERSVDLVVLGAVSLLVLRLRLRKKLEMEMGALILLGTVLSISSHFFPWYAAILLALVVVGLGPIWTDKGFIAKDLALASVWYLVCTILTGYFISTSNNWMVFYLCVYDIALLGLIWAVAPGIWRWRRGRYLIGEKEKEDPQP